MRFRLMQKCTLKVGLHLWGMDVSAVWDTILKYSWMRGFSRAESKVESSMKWWPNIFFPKDSRVSQLISLRNYDWAVVIHRRSQLPTFWESIWRDRWKWEYLADSWLWTFITYKGERKCVGVAIYKATKVWCETHKFNEHTLYKVAERIWC